MKISRFIVLFGLVLSTGVPAARGAAACADPAGGGEWRSYGHDLSNTRNQDLEDQIAPGNAGSLTAEWAVSTSQLRASGGYSNTPVVADGCVYLATNTGYVIAINAETGELVWTSQKFSGPAQTALTGGVIIGSPAVGNGMVYVGVNRQNTPFVAALDQATGIVQWTAVVTGYLPPPEQSNSSAQIPAGAVYYETPAGEPRIFMGFAGSEGSSNPRGGFAIVDGSQTCDPANMHIEPDPEKPAIDTCNPAAFSAGASGGTIKVHTYTIDNADMERGYRGASIWCTAAIDPVGQHAYACGGNPVTKKQEHRYANALLKMDLDESSPTFGEIVDSYKGEYDTYYPGLDNQPLCEGYGDQLRVVWSLACLQLDLDFGASPTLFRDDDGNLMLGDLQKSGVYHALYADHMDRAWRALVGTPCLACNAASPAVDQARRQVYTATYAPGAMFALGTHRGSYRWAAPFGDTPHFQPVSTANGVVYTVDWLGSLLAFDASNGAPLLRRPISLDVGEIVTDSSSQGVAIARNTVYVPTASWLVAYRLP